MRNKLNRKFADQMEGILPETKDNEAVKALFGYMAKEDDGQRGNLLLSDVYMETTECKLLNHVAIDRFTGGALAGALFNEEVVFGNGELYKLEIQLKKGSFLSENTHIEESLLLTLKDVCRGMLPFGGGTMRGHGTFTGNLFFNGKEVQL